MAIPEIVYLLCFFTSGLCAYLLSAAFARHKERLLLWSALCFWLIAIDNLLVFIDIILLPNISLLLLRLVVSLAAIGVLLFGFVWEIQ